MSEQDDEINLSELDDEELVQQMFDDLYDGLRKRSRKALISCSGGTGRLIGF